MEQENWIQTILESTNGMTKSSPKNDLFSKIQYRIQQQNNVEPKTIWLVAASIATLVLINIAVLNNKTNEKESTSTISLADQVDKSNQLYQ